MTGGIAKACDQTPHLFRRVDVACKKNEGPRPRRTKESAFGFIEHEPPRIHRSPRKHSSRPDEAALPCVSSCPQSPSAADFRDNRRAAGNRCLLAEIGALNVDDERAEQIGKLCPELFEGIARRRLVTESSKLPTCVPTLLATGGCVTGA